MTNASKAKKFETQVYDYILNDKGVLSENYSSLIDRFKSNVKIDKQSVILRPKKDDYYIVNPKMKEPPSCVYSNYKESKSDLFFTDVLGKKYGVSIKKEALGEAYINTINNVNDAEILFLGLPFSSLLSKEEKDFISKTLQESLIKIHNFNPAKGKTPEETVEDVFAKKNKQNKSNEFLYNEFLEKSNRKISSQELKTSVIEAYTVKKDYDIYRETLSLQEKNVQRMFEIIFNNKNYALELLKEMLTGNYKFNNIFPFKANYILCAEHFQLIDQEMVEMYYNYFITQPEIGRLQNVPRRGFSKNVICDMNLSNDELVNKFATADLSIKL